MDTLDEQAWERFVAYRKAIKKPIKPESETAAKLKLAKFGKDQAAVVDQSIANSWQGLFELKNKKDRPEKPEKTDAQIAKADADLIRQMDYSIKGWELREPDPMSKLRLCDALLARYTVAPDLDTSEKIEWLKDVAGMHIRNTDPKLVYADPHVMGMIRSLFGDAACQRIRERATH